MSSEAARFNTIAKTGTFAGPDWFRWNGVWDYEMVVEIVLKIYRWKELYPALSGKNQRTGDRSVRNAAP